MLDLVRHVFIRFASWLHICNEVETFTGPDGYQYDRCLKCGNITCAVGKGW